MSVGVETGRRFGLESIDVLADRHRGVVPPESPPAWVAVAPPCTAVAVLTIYEANCSWPLGMYAARYRGLMAPGVWMPLTVERQALRVRDLVIHADGAVRGDGRRDDR